ncbi:MAG: HAD family hydrolase [Spiroplasma sp.]|nr:HAD family hydrolase [Spiroplasma sp.]
MAIKLIALDLDGTLLKTKWKIHRKNLEMIKRVYQEKPDIKVVIATGRAPNSTIKHAKKLLVEQKAGHIICYNGGNVISLVEGKEKILFEKPLSPSQVKDIFAFAKKHNLKFWAYGADNQTAYINSCSFKIFILENFNKLKVKKVTDNQIVSLYKVLLFCKNKKQEPLILKELTKKYPDLELATSSHAVIEINPLGVNKASGLQFLANKWGIKPEEILACGDSMNDYKMFEWVKYGVAMGNSRPELKAIAYDVATTNKKGGVADAIQKYVLS